MTEQQEKKNKYIALFITLGVHGLLLLAFLLIMAWRAPNPPLPEYGIELNFGLEQQGGGDIQPEQPVGAEEQQEEPTPEQANPEQTEEVEKVEEASAEVPVSKQESPVVVKEEKKEPVKETKKEPVKETKTNTPVVKEETKVTEQKTTAGEVKKSQGDDPTKTGDQGNPEGKLDAKALYGQQGGGGGDGFDLSMSGWAWAETPKIPKLPDNEDGRIVFEIECDEDGEIVGITTLERGLSPQAEKLLKDEIKRNSLYRTSGGKVPERSKGKVVFLLKSK